MGEDEFRDLESRILYEDNHILVFNKRPGEIVQADKTGDECLAETLKARVGKTVKLKTTVDESLIGGLVVKLGSTMIDTSVKAKLAALQNAMKEVG